MTLPDGGEELTCRDLIDFLRAYLDGELPPALRQRFEDHLDACPPCLHYLDSYRETVSLVGQAWEDDGPVPEDVPEELVRAVLAARGSRS